MTTTAVRPKAGAVPVKAAVNPQVRAGTGSTPARTVGARGAKSVPPAAAAPPAPSRRRGFTPLTPMRRDAAKSMRKLAGSLEQSHPEMTVHQHVRDAAKTLEAGNEEAAQRHLRAAMYSLSPQSIYRHGITTDDGHIQARQAMHGVHRHLLLVKDITDVAAKNQAAIRRDSYGDYESGPSLPSSPVRADPNAGYGPGALAQKPTARQPGGDRALNAPDRTNSGGSDPAVADPVGPQPKGSKQFATWDQVCRVIELVGPKGYVHGWIKAAGLPAGSTLYHGTSSSLKPGDIVHPNYGWAHVTSKPFVAATYARLRAGTEAGHVKGGHIYKVEPLGPVERDEHVSGIGATSSYRSQAGFRVVGEHEKTPDEEYFGTLSPPKPKAAPTASLARAWDDLAAVIALSAETGRLAVTPNPLGKKGLWHVKGMELPPYVQNIAHALLRTGRAKTKSQAIAMARAATERWKAGGGHVRPEVRAAAAASDAQWQAKRARAHAHAATWDDVGRRIDLAAAPPPKPPPPKPDAHQQHIAHLQHLSTHGTPQQQAAAKTLLAASAASSSASAQPRVKAGVPAGGQFAPPGSGGSAPAGSKTKSAAAAKTAKTARTAPGTAKAAAGQWTPANQAQAVAGHQPGATAAQQHMAHIAHLRHLAATGKATPAQKTQLAGLMAPAAKTAAAKAAAKAPAAKKAAAAPKVKAAAAPKAPAKAAAPAASSPAAASAPSATPAAAPLAASSSPAPPAPSASSAPATPSPAAPASAPAPAAQPPVTPAAAIKAAQSAPPPSGPPVAAPLRSAPVFNRDGSVTATVAGKQMTLSGQQWQKLRRAQLQAAGAP